MSFKMEMIAAVRTKSVNSASVEFCVNVELALNGIPGLPMSVTESTDGRYGYGPVRKTLERLAATGRIRDGLTRQRGHPYPSVYGSTGCIIRPIRRAQKTTDITCLPPVFDGRNPSNGCTRPFWLPESQAYGTGTGRIVS
ncbi:hypothetical protein B0H19DRAFT_1068740 [Mycena capillaripes]|nr:hypothetical protein B0H19DRAFT_1068740 [Mycena capillaripes]